MSTGGRGGGSWSEEMEGGARNQHFPVKLERQDRKSDVPAPMT